MIAPHDTSHMHEVNGHSDENRSASLLLHWAKPTGRSFVNRCYNMPTHLLIPLQPNDSLLARVLSLNASMKNENTYPQLFNNHRKFHEDAFEKAPPEADDAGSFGRQGSTALIVIAARPG